MNTAALREQTVHLARAGCDIAPVAVCTGTTMTILSVRWVVSALTAFVTPLVLHAQVKVLMNRYGGQRTGANLTSSSAGATAISVDFTGTSTAVMGAAEVAHDERLPRYHQHERDHPGRRTRAHR